MHMALRSKVIERMIAAELVNAAGLLNVVIFFLLAVIVLIVIRIT